MTKPMYIDINDTVYNVSKYKDGVKLKKGKAYIKGEYVYPFRGKFNDGKKKVGIYKKDDDSVVFIKPFGKTRRLKYNIKNIYTIDLNEVVDIITKEGVMEPDLDVIMGETDSVFAPIITSGDNPLQILIKKALQNKQIDLKNYKNRFANSSKMSNCKGALLKHGKMSFEKFLIWCDVLDIEVELIIKDKPKCANPMETQHSYMNNIKK